MHDMTTIRHELKIKGRLTMNIPTYPPDWSKYIWNNPGKVIYGPVESRRLGYSLGINLFPGKKYCSFNCVYCDCGATQAFKLTTEVLLTIERLREAIEHEFAQHEKMNTPIDYITFAGDCEPTLHPNFPDIVDMVIEYSKKYFPNIPTAIFTNSSTISQKQIINAILKIDRKFFKLDAVDENSFRRVNRCLLPISFDKIVEMLHKIGPEIEISTAVIFGSKIKDYSNIDDIMNRRFIELLKYISPKMIHIYPIDYPASVPEIARKTDLFRTMYKLFEVGAYLTDNLPFHTNIIMTREPFKENRNA